MTKVLDLIDHEFVYFVTSREYDKTNTALTGYHPLTIIWENSWAFEQGEILEELLEGRRPLCLFEIIYD